MLSKWTIVIVNIAVYPVQDLGMHKEEIHSKLVAIMRERLSTNLKQLPLVATTWTASPPAQGSPPPPSPFAQTNAKQLRILSQVCCSAFRTCLKPHALRSIPVMVLLLQ